MFLFRVFGRVLVVTIGIALQIVIAVQSPTTLRLVQRIADTANDTLTEALPDAYAVWVDMVGADTIFVHLIFICIAIVGVELLARLWKKYFSLNADNVGAGGIPSCPDLCFMKKIDNFVK